MPAKVCVARWCRSSRICPCMLSSPGWYFSTLCSWPPASANSAEKPSPNLGARHEIREDCILDCGNLGPVDPHAAILGTNAVRLCFFRAARKHLLLLQPSVCRKRFNATQGLEMAEELMTFILQ